MWALFKLQTKTAIKNPATMMMLIMPILLVSIMGTVYSHDTASYTQLVGSIIVLNLVATTMISFGMTLFEMKKSILMKRIGASSITKTQAMLSFFAFSSMMGIIGIFWTMTISTILGASGVINNYGMEGTPGYVAEAAKFDWGLIHWGSFIWATLWGILLSLSMGFFFVSVSKTIEMFNMMSMLYMMVFMFMAGIFFPAQDEWMIYVSYAIPHSYVASSMKAAFAGENIFNLTEAMTLSGSVTEIVFSQPVVAANLLVPMVGVAFFSGISVKTFHWDD